jgi:hypothetical protein
MVGACRASGQRRQALKKLILEGNEKGWWKNKLLDDKDTLKPLELLRDCETRWSSMYNMAGRFLFVFPVRLLNSWYI